LNSPRRGLELLGLSQDVINLLTGCAFVVFSGAWLVLQLLADTKANVMCLQRDVFILIAGGSYPTPSKHQQSAAK